MATFIHSCSPTIECRGNSMEEETKDSPPASPRDIKGYIRGSNTTDTDGPSYHEKTQVEQKFKRILLEIAKEESRMKPVVENVMSCVQCAIKGEMVPIEVKQNLLEGGGLDILVKIERKGISERDVQTVIHKLVYMLSGRDTTVQEKIGQLQGIQLIIHSMLKYKHDVDLLNGAVQALLYLTPSDANRKLIGNFFGIEVTLSCMKTYRENCSLQGKGCALLGNVAYQNVLNKQIIIGIGGIKTILRGMKKCKHNSLVAFWGCLALRNISFEYEDAKNKIGLQGGIKSILIALVTFKEDTDVQEQGCAALRNITDHHKENQKLLLDMRGLEVVVSCMKRFRTIFSVHENSISLIKSILIMHPLVAEKLVNVGAIEAVLSAMIHYRPIKEFQQKGIDLVNYMARSGDAAREKIIAAGGVETINATLRVHIMELDLVETGVTLQRYLRNRERLRQM